MGGTKIRLWQLCYTSAQPFGLFESRIAVQTLYSTALTLEKKVVDGWYATISTFQHDYGMRRLARK